MSKDKSEIEVGTKVNVPHLEEIAVGNNESPSCTGIVEQEDRGDVVFVLMDNPPRRISCFKSQCNII